MKNPHKLPKYEIFHILINFVKIKKIIKILQKISKNVEN